MRALQTSRNALVMLLVSVALSTTLGCSCSAAELPAFPGAEGWGSTTPGGRGGNVIYVTSLADSGPGTLRAALETRGPRTIVFGVSGVIKLRSTLSLGGGWNPDDGDNPYSFVTIAGQSAPGGGICISGRPFVLDNGVHDVVIRHVRFRDSSDDCLGLYNGVHHVVFDHCSLSWSTDENIGFYRNPTDITIQYCVIAEGLVHGEHQKGSHSMGALVARGADRIAMHHNFFTGNGARNPLLCGGNTEEWRAEGFVAHPVFDIRNNIIYNCAQSTAVNSGAHANIVGNVYVQGPSTSPHKSAVFVPDVEDGTKVYLDGNIGPHLTPDGNQWSMVRVYSADIKDVAKQYGRKPDVFRAPAPFPASPVTMVTAERVPELVLAQAGALPHDETDLRLAGEFRARKGECGAPDRTHDTPFAPPEPGVAPPDTDSDGMPDTWEVKYGLNANRPGDERGDPDGDGYTNLEEYLNGTDPKNRPGA